MQKMDFIWLMLWDILSLCGCFVLSRQIMFHARLLLIKSFLSFDATLLLYFAIL